MDILFLTNLYPKENEKEVRSKMSVDMNDAAIALQWNLGTWKTKKLLDWVEDFNPDVVFFASGDYAFIYKVALILAKYKNIPIVVSCMDDYYLYNKNENKSLGKLAHRLFMTQVKKTMDYASCIVTICEKMSSDYEALFKKPCFTLHTPSTITAPLKSIKTNKISYIGNLGYNRNEQLIILGKALKEINCENKPQYLDIYSAETRNEIIKDFTEENGIKFHGAISAEQVLDVMGKSLAVIHTESFDGKNRKIVAYSVSTKIADSLASGTCILAYGPQEVASIEYLHENGAAICVTDTLKLKNGLIKLISDSEARSKTIETALKLAEKNHSLQANTLLVKKVLEKYSKK